VSFIANTYLRRLDFIVGELNQLSFSPNQDRYRWNERILLVHATTLTNKCELAKCSKTFGSAGFSKENVSEFLNLLVRNVENKTDCIIIYVHNVD
jgi:hypothetical protein